MSDSFSRDLVNQLRELGAADPRDAEIERLTKLVSDSEAQRYASCSLLLSRVKKAEAERDEARAEVERLTVERDLAEARYTKACQTIEEFAQRAEKAEAENQRLREALSLTKRADDLREVYHRLPNERNRIGDKRSRKSHARDAWLRAFRKAAKAARAALSSGEASRD